MSRIIPPVDITAMRRDLRRLSHYAGIYSVVARQLSVTPTHVRAVALGERSSSRVEKALICELEKRLTAKAALWVDSLFFQI